MALHPIHTDDSPASIIVLVPALGNNHLPWRVATDSVWCNIGRSVSTSVAVFGFEHAVPLNAAFKWQDILDSGAVLLDRLVELRRTYELQERPIVFISHSLGGIPVKHALCLASQNPVQYRSFMENVAGTCFIGTPHSKSDDVEIWKPVKLILHSKLPHLSKQPIRIPDAAMFANVSRRFEEADLPCPVLSICENQETKIKNTLRPSTRALLVNYKFAKTNVRTEKMLELNRPHHELCDITQDSFTFQELKKWIDTAFETSNSRLSYQRSNNTPSSPDTTIAQSSTLGSSTSPTTTLSVPSPYSHATSSLGGQYDVVANLTDFTPSRNVAKLPCYLTSSTPNKEFFGRTEVLKMLETKLVPYRPPNSTADDRPKGLRTFALCAPGGMGKTQIADRFVQTFQRSYDAVFWLHADQTSKLAEGYSQMAAKLGLVEERSPNARDQIVCRELVKGWLAKPLKQSPKGMSEADWLIVFDNADDPDTLNDFWPVDGTGSILVTSRNPLAKTNIIYAGTSGIDLRPFSPEDATRFLLQLTGRQKTADKYPIAQAVAKRLGGYPLAITQMANLIHRQQLSFEEFLLRYNDEDSINELHRLQLGGHRGRYSHTLSTVFDLDSLKHGTALLEVLSLLDPDRIHEFILTDGASKVKLSGYPTNTSAYQNARYELLQSSLVTRKIDEGRLMIHRVVQDSARARMTSARIAEVFEAAVVLLRTVYPPVLPHQHRSTARWSKCEPLFPNVIPLKEAFQRIQLPPTYIHARLSFAEILNSAGWFHHDYERRNSPGADCFALAQRICESIDTSSDGELETEVDALLGAIHYSQGTIAIELNDAEKALKHHGAFAEKRIKISNKPEGKKADTYLAGAYNEQGNAYMMVGRYQEAKTFYQNSLETYESLPEFTRVMISLPMVNLGLANWLLGDLDAASKILLIALGDREKEYGVDDIVDFRTGRILHALGNVKMDQGQLEESFQYHQRALRTVLDQALKIWGDQKYYRPNRARTLYKKAHALKVMGREAEAQKCLDQAYSLRHQLVPQERRQDYLLTEADFDDLVIFWSK